MTPFTRPSLRCTSATAARNAGSSHVQRRALHEHRLVGRLREGLGQRRVGAAGLARRPVLVGQEFRARGPAEDQCGDHERQPSEDGGLAVPGAPAPGPRCDVPCGFHATPESLRCGSRAHGGARRPRVWLSARPASWPSGAAARRPRRASRPDRAATTRRRRARGPWPGPTRRPRAARPTNSTRPEGMRISASAVSCVGHHRPLLLELAGERVGGVLAHLDRAAGAQRPAAGPAGHPGRAAAGQPAPVGVAHHAQRRDAVDRVVAQAQRPADGLAAPGPCPRRPRASPASRAAMPSWVGEPRSPSSASAASAAAWPRARRRRRASCQRTVTRLGGPRAPRQHARLGRLTPIAATAAPRASGSPARARRPRPRWRARRG